MGVLVKLFILVLCISCVICEDEESTTDATTESATVVALAVEEVEDAVNIDVGRYTTLTFDYYNNQYLKGENEDYNDKCIDEFIRCTLNLSSQTPICSFNNPYDRSRGYVTTMSYCDVFFDNCRRELRVWRVLDSGQCRFYYYNSQDNVHNTRRWKNNPLAYNLLEILSRISGNTEISISNLLTSKSDGSKTDRKWIYLKGTPVYELKKRDALLHFLNTYSGNSKIYSKYSTEVLPVSMKNRAYRRKTKSEPWFN